jgi:YidC/Oxa1 family membrane protein insertase
MDKNTIIGLSLIGLIIIGYSIFTQPSQEELRAVQHRRDSVEAIEKQQLSLDSIKNLAAIKEPNVELSDSVKHEKEKERLGDFATMLNGTEQYFTIENNLLKVVVSSKGGKIKKAELKEYKTWDGLPLQLLNSDSSIFNISFSAQNRIINTNELYFTSSESQDKNIHLRLPIADQKYIEYVYSLPKDSYMLGFKINVVGMEDVLSSNSTYLNVDWNNDVIKSEKSIDNERKATTIYYRFSDEDVDFISEGSDKKESLKTKVKWIAFKQQFFSSILIADKGFDSPVVETATDKSSTREVKKLTASFSLPYDRQKMQSYDLRMYIGPNHYQTLKKIDNLNLEKIIKLGWGIFGWVNRFLVIPTFNFLDSLNFNYGIIILILTVLVRIILLPLTFGSFKSQAKMRVLQPEMTELNEKFKDDPMKKQQETMALYRKAGVNPFGGCIPGLLQLPILIAMFSFFPSSIELRQQSFLWATDLSTYDSILDFGFRIPGYGNHISLFTLLMTISTILYTRVNMAMTTAANPQMKWMMYLMPIIFLGVFNDYSAGLSYYYFLSNIFGFGQQYLFKYFIDEEKIHAKIQENKKKPVKKSSFQSRMEQMVKERQAQSRRK